MVERGEKNTYSDGLPKAIRIIDNKKVFYKKKKIIIIQKILYR